MGVWECPDAAYACRLVRYLVGDLICAVKETVSESPYEKAKKSILQIVALAGRGGILKQDLTRKRRHSVRFRGLALRHPSTRLQKSFKILQGVLKDLLYFTILGARILQWALKDFEGFLKDF